MILKPSGKPEILSCSDPCNYETDGDPRVVDSQQTPYEDSLLILRDDREVAVKELRMGKLVRVYSIPTEFDKAG